MSNELHVQAALARDNAGLAEAVEGRRLRTVRERRLQPRIVIGGRAGSERGLIAVAIARGS